MPATRDTTCDLIERPKPMPGLLQTPHADDLSDGLVSASVASQTLLSCGCLIREIRISDSRVVFRLHRRPPPAFGVPRQTRLPCGLVIARTFWRGLHIEWPVEVS